MHSADKVLVIAVNGSSPGKHPSGGPPTLALSAPLPSEVKYSASLVRGLGWTHICLGLVLFILGILGTWAEPETSWSGTGIWGGLVAMSCGFTGLVAHKLWYKNFAIKAFLVTSVSAVLVSLLAVGITLYSIINREERFLRLLEEAKKNPWFASLSPDTHRPTLNVSINQVVGFVLELLLAIWSTKVAWRGARAVEFSSSQREAMMASQQEKQLQLYQHHQQQYATSAAGPQIPLAALYQLLQAHPELLGVKAGMNNSGWVEDLEKQRSSSMDYHERVDRYLANTLNDNRPPSTLHNDSMDHSASTVSTSGESSSDNGGRGSPSNSAETVVCTNNRQDLSTRSFRNMASVESLGEPSDIRRSNKNKKETKSKAPKPSTTQKSVKETTDKMEVPPKDNNTQKYDAVKKSVATQDDNKEKKKIKKNLESDSNKENMESGIKIKPSDIKKAIVVEEIDSNEQVSNLIQEKTYQVSTLKKENHHKSVNNKELKENTKNSEKILDDKDIKLEMFEKRNENSECANIMPSDNKNKVTHIDAKPIPEIETDSLEAINDKLTEQNSSILGQQRGENKNSSTKNSVTDIQPPSQFCDN